MGIGRNQLSIPCHWHEIGAITVEKTDLGVTGRAVATVNAVAATTVVSFSPPIPGPYAMMLRFRSDGSNNDDSVLQVYAARGNDHYNKVGQLTVVQGQQIQSGTIYFVDTITPANEDTLFDGEESNATDVIAHYYMRTLGNDRFAILCSDLDSTTVYIDACWLYE